MSENPVVEVLRVFFAGTGFEEVPPTRTYTRDDMVRAILAQQWAVAIALCYQAGVMAMVVPDEEAHAVGDLPCAHDVVEGMEQS